MSTERLSAEDARILGLESGAVTGHTCKVVIVEPRDGGPIGVDEAIAELRERC